MRYLPVYVLTNTDGVDCTNNGISVKYKDRLVVPCPDGHITAETVEAKGYVVLELRKIRDTFNFKELGEPAWCMFGGNFVYTSDSRFSRMYGSQPIPVHDRIEN